MTPAGFLGKIREASSYSPPVRDGGGCPPDNAGSVTRDQRFVERRAWVRRGIEGIFAGWILFPNVVS